MNKQFISTSSGKICIYSGEPTEKPGLLCIHGGMGLASDSLIPSLQTLSETFDLSFMDQRGHGESEAPINKSYFLENFSKDISEVVEIIKPTKPLGLFGHSMGGMIAIQTLSDFPELFQFAFLANTALDFEWQKAASEAVLSLDDLSLSKAVSDYEKNPTSVTLATLAINYGPIYFPELNRERAELEMHKFSYRPDSIAFMDKSVYPHMNLEKQIARIKIPTLVISGERDVVVPPLCQRKISARLNYGEIITIGGAGHFPFITKQKEFKKAVTDWWEIKRRGI